MGLVPTHCVGPGFLLQAWSLGAKVNSKQTPSLGKASSDRFDPGEGNVAQVRNGVGLGSAMLPPHGRRRACSLDDWTLVKLRG